MPGDLMKINGGGANQVVLRKMTIYKEAPY
jgi:hypothetical protein